MRAITVCQPFAELIARGDKWVENRTWETLYRGRLAVHAGKSRAWLDLNEDGAKDETYDIRLSEMSFGAVVAIVQLVGCLHVSSIREDANRYAWLHAHEHTEGPFCWVLESVVRIPKPIPCAGKQGLWDWKPPAGFLASLGMETIR